MSKELRPMRTVSARAVLLATLTLAGALTIAACGDDDSDSEESSTPQRLAVEVTEQGKGQFRMTAPKSVKAGLVGISLRAPAGKATTHDAQLVRVEGDHTIEEVLKFLAVEGAPTPDWLFAAGGVGQTKPGASGGATQVLTPGKYFILDTGEPEGDNVKSYAESGATAALEVTGPAGGASLPKADAKVTAKDYTFTTSGLKGGENSIEFDNAGRELHHLIAFPYRRGAALADVKKAFSDEEGESSGPPPVDFESAVGTAVLEGRTKQVTQLELKPGKYALVCFLSDRKGGPPHVAKGMIAEATIK
jgi:hypothetical protein